MVTKNGYCIISKYHCVRKENMSCGAWYCENNFFKQQPSFFASHRPQSILLNCNLIWISVQKRLSEVWTLQNNNIGWCLYGKSIITDFHSSSEWYTVSAVQRSQLREIEDNGEFWMPWSEYWKIFTDLTVCSITPDYDSDGISDGLGKWLYLQWNWNLCLSVNLTSWVWSNSNIGKVPIKFTFISTVLCLDFEKLLANVYCRLEQWQVSNMTCM